MKIIIVLLILISTIAIAGPPPMCGRPFYAPPFRPMYAPPPYAPPRYSQPFRPMYAPPPFRPGYAPPMYPQYPPPRGPMFVPFLPGISIGGPGWGIRLW